MTFVIARRKLIEETLIPAGIRDQRLLKIMGEIPRHRFVEAPFSMKAYSDNSLPIGFNQTISKPTVVARMIEGVKIQSKEKVLEVGAGSGYQTVILSRLARRVIAVEFYEEFIRRLKPLLSELDCWNVSLKKASDQLGYAKEAPFDVIICSACLRKIPLALKKQLHPDGGRLVAPLHVGQEQRIRLIQMQNGFPIEKDLGNCVFVPILKSKSFTPEKRV